MNYVPTRQGIEDIKEGRTPLLKFPLFYGDPFPHQARAAEFVLYTTCTLLCDPVGLGKTASALLVHAKLSETRRNLKTLVVAENSHLHQWAGEIERFLHITPHIISGTRPQREKQYRAAVEEHSPIILCGHAKFRTDTELLYDTIHADYLIVDEAAILGNQNKTNAAAAAIIQSTEYSLLLTATPISKGYTGQIYELFSVLGIDLGMDRDTFDDRFVQFRTRYIWVTTKKGYRFQKEIRTPVGIKNVPEFKQLVYNNILRRPETILGPRRILNRQIRTVEMTKEQRARYDEVKDLILRRGDEETPINTLTTAIYLAEILTSPWVVDEKAKPESPKADEIVNIVRALGEEKVVVFAKWKRSHFIIAKYLKKAGISFASYTGDLDTEERDEMLKQFRAAGGPQVLLITEAGSRGLNLQCARNMIFTDLLYSPAAMLQCLGRIDRIGQPSKILNVYFVVCEGSTEMDIVKRLHLRQTICDTALGEQGAHVFDFGDTEKLLLDFKS
jgi:SNF2 family DNA or RNA helicase